jgi:hypothetical protein
MTTHEIAWVPCQEPGCDAGLVIDARHARNFDGRDWYCTDHETNDRSTR